MCCLCLCGRAEADSGNLIYGSSACGILMRLGDLEGKSVSCYIEELQFQILID